MYDRTITLFNYREQDGLWRTSLFKGVNIDELTARSASTQGASNNSYVDIILPSDSRMRVNKIQYVSPKDYQSLDDVAGYFTLSPNVDFIVIGDSTSDEPIVEDDYDEGLYHAMNDVNDGVYKITSAAWFSLLPHFEIEGR